MSTTHEAVIALEYLISTLSGDTTLSTLAPGGCFRGLAPPNTVTPFVIVGYQSGVDVLTMNAVRLFSTPLYMVKVVGPADITPTIAQGAARVDELLRRTSGTATGGLVLVCYRESPLLLDELVNGTQWVSIGGLYRAEVQQTS